jgi:threonine/homoserine/homoserine lactone efflux protein
MRLWQILAVAFLTGFSGAMMPGPLLALVIGQVLTIGFMAVIWLVLGHALLELVTVALLMAGLRVVLNRPAVRGGIGLVGGAALFYMGFDMVRSAPHLMLQTSGVAAVPIGHLILAGAVVCAANPYYIGWWATVGAGQLAHMGAHKPSEYLVFYLGHELSDFTWYALVGLLLVLSRELLLGGWYNWLVGICGAIIALVALLFFSSGIKLIIAARRPPAAELATEE